MTDPIEELQALTERLWARTGLGSCARIAGVPQDDGSAHVEHVADRYDIVVTERGQEFERMTGLSLDEAARWLLIGMAERHAQSAELQSRSPPEHAPPNPGDIDHDGYSRWNWMAPAVETMRRISPEFGGWAQRRYLQILRVAPLKDYEKRNARYPLPSCE